MMYSCLQCRYFGEKDIGLLDTVKWNCIVSLYELCYGKLHCSVVICSSSSFSPALLLDAVRLLQIPRDSASQDRHPPLPSLLVPTAIQREVGDDK